METRGLQRAYKAGNTSNQKALDGILLGRRTRCGKRYALRMEAEEKVESIKEARRLARTKFYEQRKVNAEKKVQASKPGMLKRALMRLRRIFSSQAGE
jgi:hypothetical protein